MSTATTDVTDTKNILFRPKAATRRKKRSKRKKSRMATAKLFGRDANAIIKRLNNFEPEKWKLPKISRSNSKFDVSY